MFSNVLKCCLVSCTRSQSGFALEFTKLSDGLSAHTGKSLTSQSTSLYCFIALIAFMVGTDSALHMLSIIKWIVNVLDN